MRDNLELLAKIFLFFLIIGSLIFTLVLRSEGYYSYGGLGGLYGSNLYGGSSLYGSGGLSSYGLGGLGMYGLGGLGGYGLGSSLYGGSLYGLSGLGGYCLGGLGMYGLGGSGGYGLGGSLYGGSLYCSSGLGGYGLGGLGMYGLGGLGGLGLGSSLYGGNLYGLSGLGSMYGAGSITASPSNNGNAYYYGTSGYGSPIGLGLTNPLLALAGAGGISAVPSLAPPVVAEQAGVWQGTWSAGFLFADMTMVIIENPVTGFISGTVTLAGNYAIPTAVDVYGTTNPYAIDLSGIGPGGLYALSINGILNSPTEMTGTWAIVKVSTGIVAKVLGIDQTGSFTVTLVNAPTVAPPVVAPTVVAPIASPTVITPTVVQPTAIPLLINPTVAIPTAFAPTVIAPIVAPPTAILPPIIAPTVIPPVTAVVPAAISGGLLYLALFGL